jgi:hypothetical protein
LIGPLGKELVIDEGSIHDHDASLGKIQGAGHCQLVLPAFANRSEHRQVTIVIEQKMEFNGSFGLTKFGPVKETQTQIDHRRVETEEFILETEAFSGSKTASRIQ